MKHFPLFGLSIVLVAFACTKDGPSNDDGAEYDGWWYLESVSDVVQLEPVSDNLWERYEQEFTASSTCLWVYISHYMVTKYGNAAYNAFYPTNSEFTMGELPYIYEGPASVETVTPWGGDDDGCYTKSNMYDCMLHPGKFAPGPDVDYMDVHLGNGRLSFSCSESGTLHLRGDLNADGKVDKNDGWMFDYRGAFFKGIRIDEDGIIWGIEFEEDHLPYSYKWTNTWVRSDEAHFRSWTEHNQVWFDRF